MTQVVKAPGGRRLSVESLGDPAGIPVFLMHGSPGSRNGPNPRGPVLYRLGVRLICYDRPGYPGSDRFPGRTVADAAGDVKAIAEYFGIDRFSVVGRSGGAPHALACAALLKDQVICAAALGSLAPYDADEGLDWAAGMAESNVRAYECAAENSTALESTLDERAVHVRGDSESLLKELWPELGRDDKNVMGDIALRRIIAETHADALRESANGWIDDVIALSRPWGFDLSDIIAPVKLWHGSDDVFSPPSHTHWLAKRIGTADPQVEIQVEIGAAHFGAVEILPRILTWVVKQAKKESRSAAAAVAATAAAGNGSRPLSLAGAGPGRVSAEAGAAR
ncbi:MAG TPA: alpha/beta hydrolase [Streptosporangiaceae bacterium]|nr:alpha/beta hydrolase [Streptosporangiaceae bacterium]